MTRDVKTVGRTLLRANDALKRMVLHQRAASRPNFCASSSSAPDGGDKTLPEVKLRRRNARRREYKAETKAPTSSLFQEVDEILKKKKKRSKPPEPPPKKTTTTAAAPRKEPPSKPVSPFEVTDATAKSVPKPNPPHLFSDSGLLDVLKLPETRKRSPNAFDEASWNEYLQILEPMVEKHPKFRREHTSKPIDPAKASAVEAWLRAEEPVVEYNLATWKKAIRQGIEPITTDLAQNERGAFATEAQEQKEKLMQQLEFDEKQYKMAQGALSHLSKQCASQAKGLPLTVLWEKIKEAGITDKGTLHTLMYVSSTFAPVNRLKSARFRNLTGVSILDVLDQQSNTTGKDDQISAEDLVDKTDEIAIYHDLLYEPTEQSIVVRVRLLVAQGNARQAEELLCKYHDKVEIRLRAFTPVLKLFLEQRDLNSALRLYKRMLAMPLVHLEAETYSSIIAGLAENGCFRPNAAPLEVAHDLGYSASYGPVLLDEIVSEMAKDVLELPLTSAKKIYNAFVEGYPESNLEKTSSLAPLRVNCERAAPNELIASRCTVESSTGVCTRSGVKLRLISLEEEEKETLKEAILSLARAGQLQYQETKNIPSDKRNRVRADEELLAFYSWLDDRNGKPFTCVVDGANVGYYMQNFEGGRFSFHQIGFVVDALEKLGERPLVVLPAKYFRDSFPITIGDMKQEVTREEARIRDGLLSSGKVFVVPAGNLDDYFWILASVSNQSTSRNGADLSVPANNEDGRWPGTRPILISNDQMRDHKLELLEPRLFRRWHSNFIVNYHFTGFVGDECPNPEIGFSPSDFFSREIQGNLADDGSTVWHFPLTDTTDEWFCLRIPTKIVKKR